MSNEAAELKAELATLLTTLRCEISRAETVTAHLQEQLASKHVEADHTDDRELNSLTVRVVFDTDERPGSAVFKGIHHIECHDGVLMLHELEDGLVKAFSPRSKWSGVEVITPEINFRDGKKPGEA